MGYELQQFALLRHNYHPMWTWWDSHHRPFGWRIHWCMSSIIKLAPPHKHSQTPDNLFLFLSGSLAARTSRFHFKSSNHFVDKYNFFLFPEKTFLGTTSYPRAERVQQLVGRCQPLGVKAHCGTTCIKMILESKGTWVECWQGLLTKVLFKIFAWGSQVITCSIYSCDPLHRKQVLPSPGRIY